tara:strand:- start:11930 stop:12226 length:297 start_codon:yes stop_codon:yes gene_type:complete
MEGGLLIGHPGVQALNFGGRNTLWLPGRKAEMRVGCEEHSLWGRKMSVPVKNLDRHFGGRYGDGTLFLADMFNRISPMCALAQLLVRSYAARRLPIQK